MFGVHHFTFPARPNTRQSEADGLAAVQQGHVAEGLVSISIVILVSQSTAQVINWHPLS